MMFSIPNGNKSSLGFKGSNLSHLGYTMLLSAHQFKFRAIISPSPSYSLSSSFSLPQVGLGYRTIWLLILWYIKIMIYISQNPRHHQISFTPELNGNNTCLVACRDGIVVLSDDLVCIQVWMWCSNVLKWTGLRRQKQQIQTEQLRKCPYALL